LPRRASIISGYPIRSGTSPACRRPTATELTALGPQAREPERIGHANCIEIDPKTSSVTAVADVQRDGGKASAY
jgi:gamma-glutamyltranspeptidase/glutathione hydrolase